MSLNFVIYDVINLKYNFCNIDCVCDNFRDQDESDTVSQENKASKNELNDDTENESFGSISNNLG